MMSRRCIGPMRLARVLACWLALTLVACASVQASTDAQSVSPDAWADRYVVNCKPLRPTLPQENKYIQDFCAQRTFFTIKANEAADHANEWKIAMSRDDGMEPGPEADAWKVWPLENFGYTGYECLSNPDSKGMVICKVPAGKDLFEGLVRALREHVKEKHPNVPELHIQSRTGMVLIFVPTFWLFDLERVAQ